MAKLPKWVWILVLGALLTLPMLGSFGLWDPAEIKHADVAREVAEKGSFADITVNGKYTARPLLHVWLIAFGFKIFGINEFAGRLPLVLVGLLGLFFAYRAGKRLFSEEAGLAAGFVLATTPAFLFQMRQLTSDISFYVGLLGAVGGFAAFLAPRDGKRERADLIIGIVGLVMAALGRGVLIGAGVPLLGLLTAGIIVYTWRARAGTASVTANSAESNESEQESRAYESTASVAKSSEEPDDAEQAEASEDPSEGTEDSTSEQSETEQSETEQSETETEQSETAQSDDSEGSKTTKDSDTDSSKDTEQFEADADAGASSEAESKSDGEPGPMQPEGASPLLPLDDALKPLLGGLAIAAVVIAAVLAMVKQGKLMLLGGVVHKMPLPPTYEVSVRDIGFSFFPWIGFLPLALWAFAAPVWQRDDEGNAKVESVDLARMAVLLTVVFGWLAAVLFPAYLGKVRSIPLPLLAVMVGVWAVSAFRRPKYLPLWGVIAAALVLAVAQDFAMRPESLAFSHLLDHARYPADLEIKTIMRVFGIGLTVLFFFALAGPPKPIKGRWRPEKGHWITRIPGVIWVVRLVAKIVNLGAAAIDGIGALFRSIAGEGNRNYWIAAGGGALVFAGFCTLWFTPKLSLHMSNKALFQTYHRCKKQGEKLSQYRVSGRGAAYYNNGQVDEVRHTNDLFKMFSSAQRAFVLVPANYLGSIDQSARQRKIPYYVLDNSSSHYLILSNKLEGNCKKDENPLRELVLSKRPTPQHKVEINFENKVKLIGYDTDPKVGRRGSSFKLTLYFQVLKRVPANFGIFVHFDKPAARIHGDHKPLDGKYPTQYWVPGSYIKDPKVIDLPILTTSSGNYSIMMGFWQRSRRLKIVSGPNDGHNRARLGIFRVK